MMRWCRSQSPGNVSSPALPSPCLQATNPHRGEVVTGLSISPWRGAPNAWCRQPNKPTIASVPCRGRSVSSLGRRFSSGGPRGRRWSSNSRAVCQRLPRSWLAMRASSRAHWLPTNTRYQSSTCSMGSSIRLFPWHWASAPGAAYVRPESMSVWMSWATRRTNSALEWLHWVRRG